MSAGLGPLQIDYNAAHALVTGTRVPEAAGEVKAQKPLLAPEVLKATQTVSSGQYEGSREQTATS